MTCILIKDLPANEILDRKAMRAVRGGVRLNFDVLAAPDLSVSDTDRRTRVSVSDISITKTMDKSSPLAF